MEHWKTGAHRILRMMDWPGVEAAKVPGRLSTRGEQSRMPHVVLGMQSAMHWRYMSVTCYEAYSLKICVYNIYIYTLIYLRVYIDFQYCFGLCLWSDYIARASSERALHTCAYIYIYTHRYVSSNIRTSGFRYREL